MADHKHDISMATGAHRPWVGESTAPRPLNRDLNRDLRALATRPAAAKPNARHAAITKGLANFPNYKTWAEKTKASWQPEKE